MRAGTRGRIVRWLSWLGHARAPGAADGGADPDDHETAELSANYWHAYERRMAAVKFGDVARRFPALIGQALRLGWSASRRDTAATVGLNLASGVFGGYALFATSGVLQALFAAGPTPHRVRAALGVLQPILLAVLLVAQLPGAWAAVRTARISYLNRFALIDSYRRKYILASLIADRRTAAELRSFTMRAFLIGSALGGVATAGVGADHHSPARVRPAR